MRFNGLFVLFLSFFAGLSAHSQDYELKSSTEIYKDLQKLHRGLRVLYLAAHPDDENTRLIAWLENKKHIETAYLSLTRGQGGQNLIGDEKGDALGVIRTYELLEARKIDGGVQMFTRAIDFGYSKSAEESFEKWGKEEVLADVVYAIRKYRPHIIITRFPPSRAAGHGHHEASAILAEEAFELAADKNAFPEQFDRVDTWSPHALYFNTSSWWRKEYEQMSEEELRKQDILRLNIGEFDPTSGLAINEIASLARSKHRCQAFGTQRDRGERFEYLQLLKGEWKDDFLDSYIGIWDRSPEHKEAFKTIIDRFSFVDMEANYISFIETIEPKLSQRNMWATARDMQYVQNLTQEIKRNMLGVRIEAYAGEVPVVVNSEYLVTIEAYNAGGESIEVRFTHPKVDTAFKLESGKSVSFTRIFTAPNLPSTPYWLREPHDDLYTISNPDWMAEPRIKDELITFSIKRNIPIRGATELHRKWVDRSIGERIQPMLYVPKVSIHHKQNKLLFFGETIQQELVVRAYEDLENLDVNLSGIVGQDRKGVSIKKGQQEEFVSNWDVGSPANEVQIIEPEVKLGEVKYTHDVQLIEYDHIPNISILSPCTLSLTRIDLESSNSKILYIEGSGDEVDEALEKIGYQVDRLPLTDVVSKLSQYQAIVVGIRAYNTNDDVVTYHDKLMKYVEDGGNLIVQYNTSRGLKSKDIGPYPMEIGRERVTEENANPTLIDPKHDIFHKPNKITDSDFENWVQERGLYFAQSWSDDYQPLISWKDSGESDMSDGALIVAKYGKGSYFYTGVSFFRQLPAGVPGAYRLLTNMIEYKP